MDSLPTLDCLAAADALICLGDTVVTSRVEKKRPGRPRRISAIYCSEPGCMYYGKFRAEHGFIYCKIHSTKYMAPIHPKDGCEDCGVYPLYGYVRATKCKKHKEPDMVYLAGFCKKGGCCVRPSYGKPADRHPTRCKNHAKPGMTHIRTRN